MGRGLILSVSLGTCLLHTLLQGFGSEAELPSQKDTYFSLEFDSAILLSSYYVRDPSEAFEEARMPK